VQEARDGWVGMWGKREQEKCRKSEGGEPTHTFWPLHVSKSTWHEMPFMSH